MTTSGDVEVLQNRCSAGDPAERTPGRGDPVSRLRAARRRENLAVHDQLSAIADLWTDWEPTEAERAADRRRGRRDTSHESLHEASVVAEVAPSLTMTEPAAARRVEASCALLVERRLPRAAALSERGDLDWSRLGILVSRTRDLTVADAAAVEAAALSTRNLRLTIGRFEKAVDPCRHRRRPRCRRTTPPRRPQGPTGRLLPRPRRHRLVLGHRAR